MADEIGLGELARRVQEVYARFESIAARIETAYVTKEVFDLNLKLFDNKLDSLKQLHTEEINGVVSENEDLSRRIKELEDDKTWLIRLVIGAIILAFLGAGFAASKAVG